MSITINQLLHFLAVARAGSFSAAARSLAIAQPAVSQSIAALERDLQARLFERTSRSCRLTALGEGFLADAERILDDLESARQRVRRLAGQGKQRIVLGMTGGLSNLLTEELLLDARASFDARTAAGGLDLVIMEGSVGRLRELMLDGRIDCALTYNVTDSDPQLRSRFIAHEPMHLVAHPDVMARYLRKGRVDLAQVARFPLFLPSVSREAGAGQLLVLEAGKHRIKLDIRYELQSTSIIRRLLLQEKLATVIGPGSIADDIGIGTLCARVIEMPGFVRSVGLAMLKSRPFGAAETRLLTAIQTVARDVLLPCGLWHTSATDFSEPDYPRFRGHRGRAT